MNDIYEYNALTRWKEGVDDVSGRRRAELSGVDDGVGQSALRARAVGVQRAL